MSQLAGPIERQSLHDAVTARLRDMIVEGEYPPGSRLPERVLCETFGISRTPLREALKVLASGKEDPRPKSLEAGTRLYREWRGKSHEVLITNEGCRWRGRDYQSLSEVARAITGTRWSGPRFFGLAR